MELELPPIWKTILTEKPITWVSNHKLIKGKPRTYTTYTASWATCVVNGEFKKAIKVNIQESHWKDMKMTEYYVKGIGFWKRVEEDNLTIITETCELSQDKPAKEQTIKHSQINQ